MEQADAGQSGGGTHNNPRRPKRQPSLCHPRPSGINMGTRATWADPKTRGALISPGLASGTREHLTQGFGMATRMATKEHQAGSRGSQPTKPSPEEWANGAGGAYYRAWLRCRLAAPPRKPRVLASGQRGGVVTRARMPAPPATTRGARDGMLMRSPTAIPQQPIG